MLTGSDSPALRRRALALPVRAVLVKPITFAELFEQIRSIDPMRLEPASTIVANSLADRSLTWLLSAILHPLGSLRFLAAVPSPTGPDQGRPEFYVNLCPFSGFLSTV